jgi:uncharacterized membrane protein (DUF106 family)
VTIEIKVNDKNADIILSILNNLKEGLIDKLIIKEIEKDFEEVKKELRYLKENNKKPQKLEEFLDEI